VNGRCAPKKLFSYAIACCDASGSSAIAASKHVRAAAREVHPAVAAAQVSGMLLTLERSCSQLQM
jgi:hypothetical protein